MKTSLPGPLAILMIVIILAAACTWILPAGEYAKLTKSDNAFVLTSAGKETSLPLAQKTLDSLGIRIALQKFIDGDIRKPVSVPGTFTRQERRGQGFIEILQAPIKGIVDSVDIILFILIIGGFMYVFNETGAMLQGITRLSQRMRGREQWLIIILTFLFSFCAGSYGMAEEAFVFYPILVPLFLAAGYDALVPLAVIFGGTSIGCIPSFSNPFATIIASNAAGINWLDGLAERLIFWGLNTALFIAYLLRYAAKVKGNPAASLVYKIDGAVKPPYETVIHQETAPVTLPPKSKWLLVIYIGSFLMMIAGVVFLKWWTTEMSALFLASSVLIALIAGISEKTFTREFIKGAESLLSVAFIIGVARGVTIVLNEGRISDSLLYFAANTVQGLSPSFFILLVLLFYIVFSLFIQSSSGMAVLTMPIIGALAVIVNIPGREIVNAYMYGMALMSLVAPTGLILPSLGMVNVSLKAWLKFITPYLILVTLLCLIALVIGIRL